VVLPPTRRSPFAAVESLDLRDLGGYGWRLANGSGLGASSRNLAEGVEQKRGVDRFGNMPVHAVGEAKIALLQRGVRRHCEDWQRREPHVGAILAVA